MDKQKTNYFIYFTAFSVCVIIFTTGTCYSWTSPFLPKFESNDSSINPIGRPITTSEAGLMVSIINLGLLTGPLISTLATGLLGKKNTILLSAVPVFTAHIICTFTTRIEFFLVARFLMGQTAGATWAVIPGYLGEICEPKNRGFLSSFITIMYTAGVLFCYCIGPFLSMMWFSIANLIPVFIFYITVVFFLPESPYDLIIKNNLKKAEYSLMRLRKSSDVYVELTEIKNAIEADKNTSGTFFDLFKTASLFRAIIICGGLMVFNSLSGIIAVFGYTQTIFDLAGSSIPSAYSAMIVGSIAFVSSLTHSKLVDILGRKVLISISCAIIFFSLSALGLFFYLQQNNFTIDSLNWLPVCSLVFVMFGFYFGLASIPYIMLGELFPSNIKTMAAGLCTSLNFCLTFTLTFFFPYLIESFGAAYTFWFFAACMAMGTLFCIMFVPETKGKSLQEINAMLNKNG